MADNLARAQLARLARGFAQQARSPLPALALFTDDVRLADPLPSIRALPRGSMVVLRERNADRRRSLAAAVSRIARERRLVWLIADDPGLATAMRAHGVHFPEAKLARAAHWRAARPRWLITGSAHSLSACTRASRAGVDVIFLSSAFTTMSHPGRPSLGLLRVRTIAKQMKIPIYPLGGIDAHAARRLAGAPLAGLAALGALAVETAQL